MAYRVALHDSMSREEGPRTNVSGRCRRTEQEGLCKLVFQPANRYVEQF